MKGKTMFTSAEAEALRSLIRQKCDADNNTQKSIRNKMRKIGFHISDFTTKKSGFTVEDFETLINDNIITIDRNEAPAFQRSNTIKELNNENGSNRKSIKGLARIVNDDSQVFFLSTMPREESLASNEYYIKSQHYF